MQYFAECVHCGKVYPVYREGLPLLPDERDCIQVEWIPDPFAQDVHGDDTPMWICGPCADSSAADI